MHSGGTQMSSAVNLWLEPDALVYDSMDAGQHNSPPGSRLHNQCSCTRQNNLLSKTSTLLFLFKLWSKPNSLSSFFIWRLIAHDKSSMWNQQMADEITPHSLIMGLRWQVTEKNEPLPINHWLIYLLESEWGSRKSQRREFAMFFQPSDSMRIKMLHLVVTKNIFLLVDK